ncbi:MAG: hypothetical protein GX425_12260 [Peptococcaceae bacterium]|nr:hypothetical protein [Peptococcaceae bacterium]
MFTPNFKIFQDNPDQVKVRIFGNNNAGFNTDSSGNLTITSTGLAIEPPSGGLTITSTGLAITSTGLAITAPGGLAITSTGLAITSTGLAITAPGGLAITSTGLAVVSGTTDVSATRANITNTAGTPDTTYEVLGVRTWTFSVVNKALVANAQALAKLQLSPDGTNWLDDSSTSTTIDQNTVKAFFSTAQLKYARIYYSAVNASSAVTLNIFFQGQL